MIWPPLYHAVLKDGAGGGMALQQVHTTELTMVHSGVPCIKLVRGGKMYFRHWLERGGMAKR